MDRVRRRLELGREILAGDQLRRDPRCTPTSATAVSNSLV